MYYHQPMQKMTWNEITAQYPDQWVSLDEVSYQENGQVKEAAVLATGPDLKTVVQESKGKSFTDHAFEYTGKVKNFLGFAEWNITDAAADL